jgi:Rrf2 family transcriptional regulator, iron-sulfur cluster assembly transcription factor
VRLELTRRGDYAVRAMLALAGRADLEPVPVREIAETMAIPVGFLPRVMADLARAGMVTSTVGRSGGYVLARPASRISLLDIIEAIEGESRRRRCVLRGGPCGLDGHCQVHDVFFAAQDAMLQRFATTSLGDVARVGERTTGRSVRSARPSRAR